ncbi:MAG: RpiB/LacA/LacB family sugar-phosphate isomerase [Candidatus Nomurabacteria bacterium]|nr:MAG: RpiB/LacA/LacB family sugar-phosphate isomerase [Candidatus Nomurabacteria bacterium]
MLYLASDHGGYQLKEKLKKQLGKANISFVDLGAKTVKPDDDYPIITKQLAEAVAKSSKHQGILVCRSGTGVCIAANKMKKIRAVAAGDAWTARRGKRDENANVLCLGSEHPNAAQSWSIVQAWLKQAFRNSTRDKRRLIQISTL